MPPKKKDSEADLEQTKDVGSDDDGGTRKSGSRKKKRKPKKKRARKKAAQKRKAESVEDLDADPGDEDSDEARERLIAEAMDLVEADPHDAEQSQAEDSDEPGPVEDLDADLDEDLDSPEALDRLIAETLVTAEVESDGAHPEADEQEPAVLAPDPIVDAAESPEEVREAVDLGPVSTPEARDRLLAEALAHSELQEARYRVPFSGPRRASWWKGLAALVLFLLAGIAAVAPPGWVLPEPPAQLDAADRARGLRMALLLQAKQVEAFRVDHLRLPDSLDELAGRLPGVVFVRSGNRAYQLIAYEADGKAIIYDSANPAPEFEALDSGWSYEEGAS